jgi:hypothetical protein
MGGGDLFFFVMRLLMWHAIFILRTDQIAQRSVSTFRLGTVAIDLIIVVFCDVDLANFKLCFASL